MDPLNQSIKKSIWVDKSSSRFPFYCPNCKAPRTLPFRPRIGGWKDYGRIGLTSAAFTLATWPLLGWKGFVSFVPLWAIYEVYHRMKVRSVIPCDKCGFDAYLYARDVDAARDAIEQFWRKKFEAKGIPFPGDEEEVYEEDDAEHELTEDESDETDLYLSDENPRNPPGASL